MVSEAAWMKSIAAHEASESGSLSTVVDLEPESVGGRTGGQGAVCAQLVVVDMYLSCVSSWNFRPCGSYSRI